jgi:hypothetical protein
MRLPVVLRMEIVRRRQDVDENDMTRAQKLKHAFLWFGIAAVVYVAGYAQGTHDMWAAMQDLLK